MLSFSHFASWLLGTVHTSLKRLANGYLVLKTSWPDHESRWIFNFQSAAKVVIASLYHTSTSDRSELADEEACIRP